MTNDKKLTSEQKNRVSELEKLIYKELQINTAASHFQWGVPSGTDDEVVKALQQIYNSDSWNVFKNYDSHKKRYYLYFYKREKK